MKLLLMLCALGLVWISPGNCMEIDEAATREVEVSDSGNESGSSTAPHESSESEESRTDRMVVTATRTQRRISETPASVSLITRDAVETMPAKTVHDLLVNQTGVVIKRSVGMGEGVPSDIIMRGVPPALAATRMLILVDGIPTNASGTPFLIVNEIPLEAIERVEIVRGPHSCLYGANAYSGVMNVITREGDGRARLDINGEAGSAVYYSGSVWSGAGSERASFSVSGGLAGVDNYLLRDLALRRRNDTLYTVEARNYGYDHRRFFGRAKLGLGSNASVLFHARYFDFDLGFGQTKKTQQPEPTVTRGTKALVGPYLTVQPSERTSLRLGAVYRHTLGEFRNEGLTSDGSYVPSRWESSGNDVLGEAQATVRLGMHTITAGIDGLWNAIDFGATLDANSNEPLMDSRPVSTAIGNLGLYAQNEIRPGSGITILPGLRGDYHSEFGWVVSPKLGLSYRVLRNLTARGSVGRGFRAPALSELAMPDIVINPDFKVRSNPRLKPEYLWAVDLGLGLERGNRHWASAAWFYNAMRGLITPDIRPDDLAQGFVTHGNTSRAWNSGIELEAGAAVASWLTVRGGYSFTHSQDDTIARNPRYADKYRGLDYVPRHKAGVELIPRMNVGPVRIEGSLGGVYTGERGYINYDGLNKDDTSIVRNYWPIVEITPPYIVLPSYLRADIAVRARIDRFWIGLSVENATDARFEESGGSWAPGRMVWLRGGVSL